MMREPNAARLLDPLGFPLHGSRLIEASAGTGKTWTIAALYVRLVLGHGEPGAAFTRALLPSEILVMTFTRAATRELSERIRARLLDAAAAFRASAPPSGADPFLHGLIAAYPSGPARAQAARRLALAADMMDEAAVFTIDAWCQRMLREHAFDSGSAFDEELSANVAPLLRDAVRDYWRQQLYPLDDAGLATALLEFPSVQRLTAILEEYLRLDLGAASEAPASAMPREDLAGLIDATQRRRTEGLRQLKQGWAERADTLGAWLDTAVNAKDSPLIKARLRQDHRKSWFEALARWANDPDADLPDLKKGRERLTAAGLQAVCKPGMSAPTHPDLLALENLHAELAALPALRPAMIGHAARWVRHRLGTLKREARTFGFDDMLARLDAALAGPNAQALRERIVAQYPVALIDEFQDTSPVQYRIFDRLYRIHDNDATTGVFLIGDPKQSIYGFRGADIHSYLAARGHTAGRHYALGVNYRSTAALVGAVNRFFEHAEGGARVPAGAPDEANGVGAEETEKADKVEATEKAEGAEAAKAAKAANPANPAKGTPSAATVATSMAPGYPPGAFRFRRGTDNPLPFQPASASGRDEAFVVAGNAAPALTVWHDAEPVSNDGYRRAFAARCAERIVTLLDDPGTGFARPGEALAPLRPGDIAILVRTGKEAHVMRQALQQRAVASVYLSEKDSVFASQEARDLSRWLAAVASPLDGRKARAAWAAQTIGLALAELARLAADDLAWDERTEQLKRLGSVWRRQGVLAMLRQTLHELDLPATLLREPGGERALTNILHLGELLQAQSQAVEGELALMRWLDEQIGDAGQANDEQLVRLESDTDLVKVVTLHKSKGLEYPLVFMPFACGFRAVDRRNRAFLHYTDARGERRIDFTCAQDALDLTDEARLQEDLRLLYVGMTRARHALWLGVAALQRGAAEGRQPKPMLHRGALGYLLGGGEAVDGAQLAERLHALAGGCADIALVPVSGRAGHTLLDRRADAASLRPAPPYQGQFDRLWSIASFSSLARDLAALPGAQAPRAGQSAREEVLLETPDDAVPAARPGTGGPWHGFPRGAVPGNFLHEQLEWLACEGFAFARGDQFDGVLEARCERAGWAHRKADTVAWLRTVATTALPPLGAALADIPTHLAEMEFWFPSDLFASRDLDALCAGHIQPGRARPGLPDKHMRGMLRGFMDLVFEWQGKYWILDYKSNALGERDGDYDNHALATAVLAHRYDVQAALYSLALHRLLARRLGENYRPREHLGGTLFLFLRGIAGPERGCHVVHATPALLDDLEQCMRQADPDHE